MSSIGEQINWICRNMIEPINVYAKVDRPNY